MGMPFGSKGGEGEGAQASAHTCNLRLSYRLVHAATPLEPGGCARAKAREQGGTTCANLRASYPALGAQGRG